ncbi:MAG: ribonuclease G [Rhodothermaceae bacterium]|nr:ribonuclease G [Rhodothermaceae bacterium]
MTSSASKPSRSRRSPEPSDDDSDEEAEPSGRSRRSRGGRSAEPKADDTETEDSSDDTSSRSRRGRSRSSSDDSKDDDSKGRSRRGGRSSDDAADEKDAADSESGNRRRSRGGRSSSNDDSPASDTSKGEDSSSGGRRGRSSSDRSSSGRSSDRNAGRSSDRSNGRSSDRSSGRSNGSQKNGSIPPNEELLRRSGKIIVKITKEAISTKGPRVSTDLSLAGRFLVLVPAADYVAVSKKIESAKERRRLRTLATSLKPDRFGVIVRTVAEGRDAKSLDTDLRLLVDKWRKIEQKLNENPEPPVLLYQDVNMVSSVIRDLFSEDYDRILVDDPKVFKNVQAYVKAVAPQMADKVELHTGRAPVFRSLGIEKQVEEAFSKRVNMRGGGYLFIETTEAMHVVDVNSGRAGRGKSQKQNLIDVNVEAAREVAKQLRLRDLGGIIVVDFIDLKYDRDRKKVTDVLKQEFAKDRAVTKLLPMSDFGLVQITRQRLRPSITANATDEDGNPLDAADAVAAAGAGEIRRQGQQAYVEPEPQPQSTEPATERPALAPEDASPRALSGRLRGWLDHYRQTVDEKYKRRPIVVRVHPLFGGYLRGGFPSLLMRWRLSLRGITFVLEEDATVDPLTFDVRDQKSGRTLLKKYTP